MQIRLTQQNDATPKSWWQETKIKARRQDATSSIADQCTAQFVLYFPAVA